MYNFFIATVLSVMFVLRLVLVEDVYCYSWRSCLRSVPVGAAFEEEQYVWIEIAGIGGEEADVPFPAVARTLGRLSQISS